MRAPSGTKKKSQGERGGASRVEVTLIETTAPEARSTAATIVVRREPTAAASAERAATCAAEVVTETEVSGAAGGPSRRQAATSRTSPTAILRSGTPRTRLYIVDRRAGQDAVRLLVGGLCRPPGRVERQIELGRIGRRHEVE